jgi:hypothetical protein
MREYGAIGNDCKNCPLQGKCLSKTQTKRSLQVSIFREIVEAHHQTDGSEKYHKALCKRQIWCEGTFAAQKARHNLTYVLGRGLRAVTDHCLLSACAVNLKRLMKHFVALLPTSISGIFTPHHALAA